MDKPKYLIKPSKSHYAPSPPKNEEIGVSTSPTSLSPTILPPIAPPSTRRISCSLVFTRKCLSISSTLNHISIEILWTQSLPPKQANSFTKSKLSDSVPPTLYSPRNKNSRRITTRNINLYLLNQE